MPVARFRPSLSLTEAWGFVAGSLRSASGAQAAFEEEFCRKLLPGQELVLAPSGRVALHWVIRALGIARGDEVITQAFNFPAVPAAIEAAGATVRFADVQPDGFNLDPQSVARAINHRTRAVVATHLYGNPADLDALTRICRSAGVALIEDCAQAVGATYHGAPVGGFGRAAFFTFGPTKNFTLLGGGAVSSGDPRLVAEVRRLAAQHPIVGRAAAARLALKAVAMTAATRPLLFSTAVHPLLCGLDRVGIDLVHRVMGEPVEALPAVALAATPSAAMVAVGARQIDRFEALNGARVRNGRYLKKRLDHVPGLVVPHFDDGCVFVSFPVYHPRPEAVARELRRRGVDTDLGFMHDCSVLPLFAGSAARARCPHSRRAAGQTLHIPVHPYVTRSQLERVVRQIEAVVGEMDGVA